MAPRVPPVRIGTGHARRTSTCLAALGMAIIVALVAVGEFADSDYEREAAPAFAALLDGDMKAFLQLAPSYGGSLVLRAPVAVAAGALGADENIVYQLGALGCLLVAAALAVALVGRMIDGGASEQSRLLVLLLCAASPITVLALTRGHPEEALTAALCVGAVLAASGRRGMLAAVLLGLAVASKPWAVLAIGPVLLALPDRRVRALLVAGAVTAVVLAPLLLAGAPSTLVRGASDTGTTFLPWQVFWFLGDPGVVAVDRNGIEYPDFRAAPAWLSGLTHPFIAMLVVPLSLLWARRRRQARAEDVLLLLALLFLLRCLLDPWNNPYYGLPMVLALLAWEALCRPHRPPYLALAVTAATWVTFQELPRVLHPDVQSLSYLVWAIPLAGWMAREAFRPARAARPATEPAPIAAAAGRHALAHRL